jgi:hypothetical protein
MPSEISGLHLVDLHVVESEMSVLALVSSVELAA